MGDTPAVLKAKWESDMSDFILLMKVEKYKLIISWNNL